MSMSGSVRTDFLFLFSPGIGQGFFVLRICECLWMNGESLISCSACRADYLNVPIIMSAIRGCNRLIRG